jgi:hypothetical protein
VARADGTVVCARCQVADSFFPRLRGLLGRRGLDEDEGMLITPAPSVHTWFMRFPIDVVFLDRDSGVVAVAGFVGPWRMRGARGARSALELPAGAAARIGLAPGERLVVE